LSVVCVTHPRARHYLLRVEDDGNVRLTIPRRGSREEALRFAREKLDWIERERYRVALKSVARGWVMESAVLLGGVVVPVEVITREGSSVARFAGREVSVEPRSGAAVVRAISSRLRREAADQLPRRLHELAQQHGYEVAAVTVRDQRGRWGSCSQSGRISLNWRLSQMPPAVCEYIMLHELAHLRYPDHSARFWREVQKICPWQREARRWLAEHGDGTLHPSRDRRSDSSSSSSGR
jgi:predicted metal-dependent hydrolase